VKELTLNEISLLEEMKSNCLKKGQYIDDKAKGKFKMLCHLEDFGIAYYELLDSIKEVREELNKIDSATYQGDTDKKTYYKYEQTRIQKLLEILDKVGSDKE
jgi:hypothetical protein